VDDEAGSGGGEDVAASDGGVGISRPLSFSTGGGITVTCVLASSCTVLPRSVPRIEISPLSSLSSPPSSLPVRHPPLLVLFWLVLPARFSRISARADAIAERHRARGSKLSLRPSATSCSVDGMCVVSQGSSNACAAVGRCFGSGFRSVRIKLLAGLCISVTFDIVEK
jgi:hypothetical protein